MRFRKHLCLFELPACYQLCERAKRKSEIQGKRERNKDNARNWLQPMQRGKQAREGKKKRDRNRKSATSVQGRGRQKEREIVAGKRGKCVALRKGRKGKRKKRGGSVISVRSERKECGREGQTKIFHSFMFSGIRLLLAIQSGSGPTCWSIQWRRRQRAWRRRIDWSKGGNETRGPPAIES